MKTAYYKEFSHELNREMEFKVYGHAGVPCLVFPAQNGRFYDFENFGMVDAASDYIENGKLQLFCCDSIDEESWSNDNEDPRRRIEQHERWFHYIVDELVQRIKSISEESNGYPCKGIMTTGCSMGGFHAANFFFRRPDIFNKVATMSGVFDAKFFFNDYEDELVHKNSPIEYLSQMEADHPNQEYYKKNDMIFCCGQGAWEGDMLDNMHRLEEIFAKQKWNAWFDYWGYDVSHDWPWWRKQFPYFLQFIL